MVSDKKIFEYSEGFRIIGKEQGPSRGINTSARWTALGMAVQKTLI